MRDGKEVPFPKDQVKKAPGIEPDGELSAREQDQLYTLTTGEQIEFDDDTAPARHGNR